MRPPAQVSRGFSTQAGGAASDSAPLTSRNAPILLGYAARELRGDLAHLRLVEKNLFRPVEGLVRSVDDMVWRDVFDLNPGFSRPGWVGYVQDLWASLDELGRALRVNSQVPGSDCSLAAFRVVHCEAESRWIGRLGPVSPAQVPGSARSLGFDVSDTFLFSPLCNGVFHADEARDELRSTWGSLLNETHLFASLEVARNFAIAARARFPEHSPFDVLEVLLL